MLDKKSRIKLRSLASTLKPVVWVGKDGFSAPALKQIEEELFNHELVKISLQENAPVPTDDELEDIVENLNADIVTKIGRKIVMYKKSEKKNISHVL